MREETIEVGDLVRIERYCEVSLNSMAIARDEKSIGRVVSESDDYYRWLVEFVNGFACFKSKDLELVDIHALTESEMLVYVDELIFARELQPDEPGCEWGFSTHSPENDTPKSPSVRAFTQQEQSIAELTADNAAKAAKLAELITTCERLTDERDTARAEIQRYRGALESIKELTSHAKTDARSMDIMTFKIYNIATDTLKDAGYEHG